jgi:glycerophosphoryl diester phosphodiesterase
MKIHPHSFTLAIGLGLCLGASGYAAAIVGHRGVAHDAPENTLLSMKLAWAQGADAIETDIHLSKDHHIVVMHDSTTKRTGGVDRKITDSTWEELQRLDVGGWKDPQFAGEKIPTLESIWATIPAGKFIFTELKTHDTAILAELARALKSSAKSVDQIQFHTFYYDMAAALKARFPDHKVYWLAGWSKDKQTGEYPKLDDLIRKAQAAHLDGLNLEAVKGNGDPGFPLDGPFVEKIHAAGMKIYPWTVDDPALARRLIAAGVDGVITNRAGWLREQLKQ